VPHQYHGLARARRPALALALLICASCARHLDSKWSPTQRLLVPTTAASSSKPALRIRRSPAPADEARTRLEPGGAAVAVAARGTHPVNALGESTPAATSTSGTLAPPNGPAWSMVVESHGPTAQHNGAAASAQGAREASITSRRTQLWATSASVLGIAALVLIAVMLWRPRRVRS
jgi:cobalamin biosynthesis Mg chelatase CobN